MSDRSLKLVVKLGYREARVSLGLISERIPDNIKHTILLIHRTGPIMVLVTAQL